MRDPPKQALVVTPTPLERATPSPLGCSIAGVGPPWPTTDAGAREFLLPPSGEYPVDRIRLSSGNIGQNIGHNPALFQNHGRCHVMRDVMRCIFCLLELFDLWNRAATAHEAE